jgi:hypothetical protein
MNLIRAGLLLSLTTAIGPSHAIAKPKAAPKPPNGIEQLKSALNAAGWTMTPERSDTYNVGDVYSRSTNTPVVFGKDCFNAEPREGAYTSLEVVQAMKAGGKVPLGIAKVKANGMEFKQLKFAEPYVKEVSDMDLMPNKKCAEFLQKRTDLDELFVIKAVLSAEVKEQNCRTADVSAGALGVRAELGITQNCVQGSDGHVAVAYKTTDVRPILPSLTPAPVAKPITVPQPLPAGLQTRLPNTASARPQQLAAMAGALPSAGVVDIQTLSAGGSALHQALSVVRKWGRVHKGLMPDGTYDPNSGISTVSIANILDILKQHNKEIKRIEYCNGSKCKAWPGGQGRWLDQFMMTDAIQTFQLRIYIKGSPNPIARNLN